jgi:ubiquinone/menaquinone biosynthesis C-methylase UbiE
MWDVIEHVPDPFGEMQQAQRILKPGGLLVVHTMDIDSLFARVMSKRWPWLMEMHIYYFSRRTLKAMLEKAGFTVVRIEPQGRYLRLGYFATRIGGFSPLLGRLLARAFRLLRVGELPVPLNFGDLVTAYAIKA